MLQILFKNYTGLSYVKGKTVYYNQKRKKKYTLTETFNGFWIVESESESVKLSVNGVQILQKSKKESESAKNIKPTGVIEEKEEKEIIRGQAANSWIKNPNRARI